MELSRRQMQIIKKLVDAKDCYLSTRELADYVKKNVRTVQSDLKEIECVLRKNGVTLLSSRSKGHCLQIDDADCFALFLSKYKENSMNEVSENEERTVYVLKRLLESNTYVKVDDLADELFLSKTSIHHLLKNIKVILKKYELTLSHKPYYGIYIDGSEKNKRDCIINEIIVVQNLFVKTKNQLFTTIYNVTSNCFIKMKYKVDDVTLMNLLMHIYANVQRMKKGLFIDFHKNEEDEFYTTFYHEIQMAEHIYHELSSMIGFEYVEDEVYALAIYMKGKRSYDNKNIISNKVDRIISEMFAYIKEKSNVDVSYDVELRVSLSLHFIPLMIRLENQMQLNNAIEMDIKKRFPFAYELATLAGAFLKEQYGYCLNDTELSYLAIHFNLSLDKQNYAMTPKKILIICASRESESLLLKYSLQKRFQEMILDIDVLNLYQIHLDELDKYDAVYTTVGNDKRIPQGAIRINYFLEEKDYSKIYHSLHLRKNKLRDFFDRELFWDCLCAADKEDAIKQMCKKALSIKKIDACLCESVLQREKLGFTSFGNLIAIPHPNDLISEETFVATAILDRPITWGTQKVQLVFMICVKKENNQDLKALFSVMSRLLMDVDKVKRIVNYRDFNYMISCLNEES